MFADVGWVLQGLVYIGGLFRVAWPGPGHFPLV